jgi:3-oxoacyl-[acyl-carrier-protein] synthase-3
LEIKDNKAYVNTYLNLGIEEIRSADHQSAVKLALSAVKKLIDQGESISDIDAVLYLQGRTPSHLMSSELAMLIYELRLENIFSTTLSGLGCVDIVSAIILANKLIASKQHKKVLICYGSIPVSQQRFRYPVTIIGDAGMALIISDNCKNHNIISAFININGKYWDLFSADYKNVPYHNWHEECKNVDEYSFDLALESKNQFEKLLQKTLQSNKLKLEDISHFVMQNISRGAFRFYEELFSIKFNDVCYVNLAQYGHLGSIDIIVNYISILSKNKPHVGSYILILNNSPIAAWSITLLRV